MRRILGLCLLALSLTVPAAAGEMPNGAPAPTPAPTPPATAEQELTTTGEDGTQGTYRDSVLQVALELLAVWPSLL